ncbi:MAG: DNA polymerase Y family protein [Verrucomicrobiaceae bacterium]
MFATLLVPEFQLQTILRQHGASPEQPAVLLDEAATASTKQQGKAPVLQATPAALRVGVQCGMTATQAQARCMGLTLYYRDAMAEERGQAELLEIAEQFTPDYESTAPGMVTMDWHGLARPEAESCLSQMSLFSEMPIPAGNRALARLTSAAEKLQRLASATGFIVRTGVAANPDLAFLTACLANPVRMLEDDASKTRAFLAPLSIQALQPPVEMADTLSLWGIRTLGDFTALPRDAVTTRLGTEAARLWDFASGTRRRLLRLVRMPLDYTQRVELEQPLGTLDLLTHYLTRILDTLTARLATAWLVAREVVLTLGFENGGVHQRELRVSEPARSTDLLLRLIHTHLEGFTTSSPIKVVALELKPTQPGQNQNDLFEHSLRDPNRFAETLAQLEALLGSENVGAPLLLPTHRPDAVRMASYVEPAEKEAPNPTHAPASAMPLRRFRPPLPAQVRVINREPIEISAGPIQGRVLAHRGPWLMSGDWWDTQRWSHEEWDVQLADGLLCRLKRENAGWSVEGLYA